MKQELIKRCQSGDSAALEELIRFLTPTIYKVAFSMLGNEHDASDAVQETFIKILKALPGFRGDASLTTWVYRITSNTCLDMLRSMGRYQTISPDDEDVFLQIPDTNPSPEDALVTGERKAAVRNAINALPDAYRLVVTLCDLNGLPYGEVATILDCPLGTVKSRLNRARALLLKKLMENQELFDRSNRPKGDKEA